MKYFEINGYNDGKTVMITKQAKSLQEILFNGNIKKLPENKILIWLLQDYGVVVAKDIKSVLNHFYSFGWKIGSENEEAIYMINQAK